MIVKIQKSTSRISATLNYNERKADGEEGIRQENTAEDMEEHGHIVKTLNVPDNSTLEEEFEKLIERNMKTKGRKLKNISFHMSVNPSETDRKMSDAEMVEFIETLMSKLGYAGTPYRIYRHNDIERQHYHVVGIRIGKDGKKINSDFEFNRKQKFLEDLSTKYGFTVSLEDSEQEEEQNERKEEDMQQPEEQNAPEQFKPVLKKEEKDKKDEKKKEYVPPYDSRSSVPKSQQIRSIHNDAMKWSFTTTEQYTMLLKWRYNVEAEEYPNSFVYIGLTDTGEKDNTPVMKERDLGLTATTDVETKIATTDMKVRRRQRERLENEIKNSLNEAKTWEGFRKAAAKKGIYVVLSWNANDEAFGVTYIDRATRCIWKGSETDVTIKWLKSMVNVKGWTMTKDRKHEAEHHKPIARTIQRKETIRKANDPARYNVGRSIFKGGGRKTEGGSADTETDEERRNRLESERNMDM